jgi:hypothetical protein
LLDGTANTYSVPPPGWSTSFTVSAYGAYWVTSSVLSWHPYKKMAEKFGAPYEQGITRLGVLRRDQWTCRMEVCLYQDRNIDSTVQRIGNGVIPDEIGSVDHIVPLSAPGTPGHVGPNVRAAHRLCNRIDLARVVGFWATGDSALLAGPVVDRVVEELLSVRHSIRKTLFGSELTTP